MGSICHSLAVYADVGSAISETMTLLNDSMSVFHSFLQMLRLSCMYPTLDCKNWRLHMQHKNLR